MLPEENYREFTLSARVEHSLPLDDFDSVKKPKHYQGKYGLEAMSVVDNFIGDLVGKAAYCWGNVIKYLLRFQKKNGVEDLKKARQDLDWLIEEMEKEDGQEEANNRNTR